MIGLTRGTVTLVDHQNEWAKNAQETIKLIDSIMKEIPHLAEHIGSTSISAIKSKPIIDICVAVESFKSVLLEKENFQKANIIFRGEDVANQLLFVIGYPEQNIITHHIHFVKLDSPAWNNYLSFRDYLNSHPNKARKYEHLKETLAEKFPYDRIKYSDSKQSLITKLLKEAAEFKKV